MGLLEEAPHGDITYKVVGAAMAVHNALGPGYNEGVYQRALEAKLPEFGLSFEPQRPVEVFIDGTAVGLFYLDFLVEGSVVVEVKALATMLTNEDLAQVITYLKATGCPVGLLINFGRRRLQFKRVLAPKKIQTPDQRVVRYTRRYNA